MAPLKLEMTISAFRGSGFDMICSCFDGIATDSSLTPKLSVTGFQVSADCVRLNLVRPRYCAIRYLPSNLPQDENTLKMSATSIWLPDWLNS
jgi:hypothetical protein